MRRFRSISLLLGLSLICSTPGHAQQPPAEAQAESGQRGIQTTASEEIDRQPPAPAEQREMDRTPVLPPLDSLLEQGGLVAVDRVFVRSISVEGRSLVDEAQVADTLAPYLDRAVSMDELDRLRQQLSLLYFERGYVNSGVVLPDQDITAGVVRFEEVSGRITAITLQGNQALRDRYWTDRLGRFGSGVLQINELQSDLQVIEQEALVKRVEARLLPGERPGESALQLDVVETRPWSLAIGLDNYRSPSLGGEQLTLYATHRSLTGRGDPLEAHANLADGLGDGGISYTLPLGWHGTKIRAYGSVGAAEIVEKPFDFIDIDTDVQAWGVELSHAFYRTPTQSLTASLGIESQQSESTLLDIPFSFSLGEVEGRSTAVAAVAGGEWIRRAAGQVLALRLSIRQGLDGLGAEVASSSPPGLNGPDSTFLSIRGQLQYVRELGWLDSELVVRGGFQLARDPLLPVEKLPIGGMRNVRGYRENLLVRDNGLHASLEWQVPVLEPGTPSGGFQPRNLSAALFADFGQSWDQDTGLASDRKERIYSIGAGLLWRPLDGLDASLYYGEGLADLPFRGDDLQDRGWHFRVAYQF